MLTALARASRHLNYFAATVVVLLPLYTTPLQGETCEIQIETPSDGASLGAKTTVEGTATLPDNSHLWVFAAIRGLRGWWPQGGGGAELLGGEWAVLAYLGGPQDIGSDFRLAAAVVNDAVNTELEAWVADGDRTGDYRPRKFPDVLEGCPVVTIKVTKVSH